MYSSLKLSFTCRISCVNPIFLLDNIDDIFNFKKQPPEVLYVKRPQACNVIKKEALAQVSSCEFCEISKNTFFTEHLWTTASKFFLSKRDATFKNIYNILCYCFIIIFTTCLFIYIIRADKQYNNIRLIFMRCSQS